MIVNNRKRPCQRVGFAVSAENRVKLNKGEKKYKCINLARELKIMEYEGDSDTSCNWRTRYSHQRIGTGTERLRNKKTRGDHPNNNIVEIGQNTKKT